MRWCSARAAGPAKEREPLALTGRDDATRSAAAWPGAARTGVIRLARIPLGRLSHLAAPLCNGCAACTDMHAKDAAHAGETQLRLNPA